MIMLQLSSDVRGHTPDKGGAKRRGDIAKTMCSQCLSNNMHRFGCGVYLHFLIIQYQYRQLNGAEIKSSDIQNIPGHNAEKFHFHFLVKTDSSFRRRQLIFIY